MWSSSLNYLVVASPVLTQAYSPMTVRFFILQSHYRGTLDFSNEALQASEKAFKRLWEAHEWFAKYAITDQAWNRCCIG